MRHNTERCCQTVDGRRGWWMRRMARRAVPPDLFPNGPAAGVAIEAGSRERMACDLPHIG